MAASDTPTKRELQEATQNGKLDLSNRKLMEFPPEILQLTDLTWLELKDNKLTALPPEIGQLIELGTLAVERNMLTALPPEIGQLNNLYQLWFEQNQLTELPPEIGQLTKLGSLWLGGNQLTELPPEIGQLINLNTLWLSDNELTALPPDIAQLTRLVTLNLNRNQLAMLPPEIAQLTTLNQLWASGNRLAAVPPEILQFTSLGDLGLAGNQLTELPPEIGQLTNLVKLDLAGNQLTELPPEIGRLTSLNELDLAGNQLTELPPEIGRLTNLKKLDLSHNKLTMLPQELADLLGKGLVVKLQGNPLNDPLPELAERGADALAIYLRSLEDAVPQYEAKLLLIGEGNVGKTSLIAALRNEPFIEGRPTTHGIEIRPLMLSHPDLDRGITLRAWDFGGQEVYRITHQFFFSQRALYLVVWKAREGQEQNEVEAWLRRIQLRVSQNARALIVATHCLERHPELDYPQLERIFPQLLVGRYEVDNSSGYGVSDLREAIAKEATKLPQMGQLISPRWTAARDEILARAETAPQITYKQFVEICKHHHVNGEEVVTLAELMHDLGQIVYYGNDEGLRDFVVLDPEWLTKAISYVLEDKLTRQSDGVLDHARLSIIWKNRQHGTTYPARYHRYFLRLMEKFDVCYRLENDEYRSLVAQLVPYDRPDLPWDIGTPLPEGIRSLALICQLSEPVPGFVAWLTVRHHRASTGRHWRNGVFLRHPIGAYASEALLELRSPDQLTLDVRAPSPDMYFNVLRDSIEDLITRRWPGLTYRLLVPCPTRASNGVRCRGQFSLEFLLGYRERGGTHAPCQECLVDQDISELLTGFAQPELPLQVELEQLNAQVADIGKDIKRVEGGVVRLEGYAAESADSMRRVLRIVGTEIVDCPRLFTLTERKPAGVRRLTRVLTHHYRLVLWCEHPGHWHPWFAASYSLAQPRDWLTQVGPYAILVFRALQVVVPVAAAVTGVILTDEQLKHAQNELKLMTTLVAQLPTRTVDDQHEFISGESASQLTPAQGQAARMLRILLFQHDEMRTFGDLRRVQGPSGDLLWVCADHYTEYDPGLPIIPGSEL
jgi:internalin A